MNMITMVRTLKMGINRISIGPFEKASNLNFSIHCRGQVLKTTCLVLMDKFGHNMLKFKIQWWVWTRWNKSMLQFSQTSIFLLCYIFCPLKKVENVLDYQSHTCTSCICSWLSGRLFVYKHLFSFYICSQCVQFKLLNQISNPEIRSMKLQRNLHNNN